MTLILNVVVALGFLVTECYSLCQWEKNTLTGRGLLQKGCLRDKVMHPLFSKWQTDDCQECVCYKHGMECCHLDSIAVGYNPKICIATKVNCTFKVVRKKDHSIPCPFKVVEIDSDSSDSSDDTKSDNDGAKIDVAEFLNLLSYFDTPENCEEDIVEEKENKSKPVESDIKAVPSPANV